MSDWGLSKLTAAITPHLELIVQEDRIKWPIPCQEGTNVCGIDGRDGLIWANDDIVFIVESDTIEAGTITFYPSHRDCAESEWGIDHLIPRRPRPFVVETPEGEVVVVAIDHHDARDAFEEALPDRKIDSITVTDVAGRSDTLLPAQVK